MMGKLSDYVSSLEGKENIDPVVVASTMLELHNEEMGTATNKIASLETVIADKDAEFTNVSTELRDQKAKNWDLVNRVPMNDNGDNANRANADDANKNASMDDFFQKEE